MKPTDYPMTTPTGTDDPEYRTGTSGPKDRLAPPKWSDWKPLKPNSRVSFRASNQMLEIRIGKEKKTVLQINYKDPDKVSLVRTSAPKEPKSSSKSAAVADRPQSAGSY